MAGLPLTALRRSGRRRLVRLLPQRCRGNTTALVARTGARVGEAVAGDGDALPGIPPRAERERQHAERDGPHLAVHANGVARYGRALTARPGDDLANAACQVHHAVGSHRLEALVLVIVAVDLQLRARVVEIDPCLFAVEQVR